MNEDCTALSCPVPAKAVQDYLNLYSLEGIIISNKLVTQTINGHTYSIPAGTFSFSISSSTGTSGLPLTFPGCQSAINIPVPSGSTQAQVEALVQSLVQQAAQQQAQCNAAVPFVGSTPTFTSNQVTLASGCTTNFPLNIVGPLPSGITQSGNNLVLAASMFTSNVSQTDADNLAVNFLVTFSDNLFSTGKAICGLGCSNDSDPLPDQTAYWLQPVKPPRVRVKNWAALKSLFASNGCAGCNAGTAFPEWDGTFVLDAANQQFKPTQGTVSVCGTTCNLCNIFLTNGFGWDFIITDAGNNHRFGEWVKPNGSQPVGTYPVHSGCAFAIPELQTIEIECY